MRQSIPRSNQNANKRINAAKIATPTARRATLGRKNHSVFSQPRSRTSQPPTKKGSKQRVRAAENSVPMRVLNPPTRASAKESRRGWRNRAMYGRRIRMVARETKNQSVQEGITNAFLPNG